MKRISHFSLKFGKLAVACFCTFLPHVLNAQWGFDAPPGQPSITAFSVPVITGSFPFDYITGSDCTVTVNGIYRIVKPANGQVYASSLWTPPAGVEVQGVWTKFTLFTKDCEFYVLTSDKHMHLISLTSTVDAKTNQVDCSLTSDKDLGTGSPNWQGDIAYPAGDDTYIATTAGQVWKTHDDSTWLVDTSGFDGNAVRALEVDTFQNVYAATAIGIYKQALSGTEWQLLPGSPASVSYFFRSKSNRIFAANYSSVWTSADGGVTWNLDTAGMGYTQVRSLSEDLAGNYYAVTTSYQYGDHVWKQTGSAPWVLIDAGLMGVAAAPTAPFIKAVAVDSGIHVATSFGTFNSYDVGATWQLLTQGISAPNIFAFYKFSNGRELATNDLGLFTKDAGDTAWQKRFPSNSYFSGIKYAVDNSGRVYAFGASRRNGYQTMPPDIYISTDRGSTWNPDTASLSQFIGGSEFVDETGTEHLATSQYQNMQLYSKAPGGTWQGDSAGFQKNPGDSPSTFASDRHGFIYLAITGTNGTRLIKRPLAGGNWTEVPTGVLGGIPYVFTATKDGKLVGGNSNISMGYYDGTSWTLIPPPPGLSNPSGFPESVDSSNRLWTIFGTIDQNYYYTPYGTYWTSDLGQHWTQAANGSYNFASLVSFGDTTYGLNSGQGLIGMTAEQASVAVPGPVTMDVTIIPNPATDDVEFDVNGTQARLEIYDIKGEKICSLHGANSIRWDLRASGFGTVPDGIYLVKGSGKTVDGETVNFSKQFVVRR